MVLGVRTIPYLLTKFEEQEPNTKLLIPDSDIYLRSAEAGSSSSSSKVSIYSKFHNNIHASSQAEHEQNLYWRDDELTLLVLHSFLNGTKISSKFAFTSSMYIATTLSSSSSTGVSSPAVENTNPTR